MDDRDLPTDGDLVLTGFRSPLGDMLVCTDGWIEEVGCGLAVPTGHVVVDLGGADLLPGLVDAHSHVQQWAVHRIAADLSGARSWDETLALVRPDDGFFLGVDYDDGAWPDPPDPRGLDRFGFPVVLRRVCGHRALASEEALDLIGRRYPWAVGDDGLTERGALALLDIVEIPMEARVGAVRAAVRDLLAVGITCVHEIAPDIDPLRRAGEPIRWVAYRTWDGAGPPPMDGFIGMKLFADGSIGSRTAWVSGGYADGSTGGAYMDREDLWSAISAAAARGIQVMVHAIGDEAVGMVADVLREVAGSHELWRPRIEHMEMVHPSSWDVLREVGVVASMQPNFVARWGMPGGMYERALGDRYLRMNLFRTALDLHLAFGSDCMPPDPFLGIRGATGHPDPSERLTVEEAVGAYTMGGAHAAGLEDEIGLIAPGRKCDVIAVRGGIPNGLEVATVVDGRIVYRRDGG